MMINYTPKQSFLVLARTYLPHISHLKSGEQEWQAGFTSFERNSYLPNLSLLI